VIDINVINTKIYTVSPWCVVMSLLGRLSSIERKLLKQGFLVVIKIEVITSEVFRSQP